MKRPVIATAPEVLLGVAVALSALVSTPVSAAETLEQAWSMALAEDPGVAAAAAESDAADAEWRAARAARLPLLEASAAYTRYDAAPALDVVTSDFAFRSPRIFSNDDSVMAGARLTLPLYAGGALVAGAEAAGQASRGAQVAARLAVADLRLEVATRYASVLRARRALDSANATVASLESHVADVTVMVERESAPNSDLLAARVVFADARQQRLRAANTVDLAQAGYNRLVGQPLDRIPELADSLPVQSAEDAKQDLASLVTTALGHREELDALDAEASALDARARAERGRARPQLALTAGYDHLETTILDREAFATIGVALRWTLFDGGQARQRARSLRRQGDATRLRREDLRSQLQLQVRERWLGVREAEARHETTAEAVSEAEENLRINREMYGVGLVTQSQVLDAIALHVAAINNRDNARSDMEIARLQLSRSVGEL